MQAQYLLALKAQNAILKHGACVSRGASFDPDYVPEEWEAEAQCMGAEFYEHDSFPYYTPR
jgi:hypothetical protein